MVSPGSHLVKNIESQSRSNESQIENIYIQVCNSKCLGLCVTRQLIFLISLTDSKLCITAVLKLKYSPSKGSRKYASFNNSHNNCHRIHKRDISTNTHVQIFLWIFSSIGLQCHEYYYFASLGIFKHQGCRMQRLTKSLHVFFCMGKRLLGDFVVKCMQ